MRQHKMLWTYNLHVRHFIFNMSKGWVLKFRLYTKDSIPMNNDGYNKAYIEELAHKWKEGTLTTEEQAYFDTWYEKHLNSPVEIKRDFAQNSDALRDRMHIKLLEKVKASKNKTNIRAINRKLLFVSAAAILLFATFLVFYYAYVV